MSKPFHHRIMYHIHSASSSTRILRTLVTPLLLILALATAGCTIQRNPVSGSKRAFGYTWEQEIRLGAESDPQIVAQFGLYEDEELAEYVDRIGRQTLEKSHMRRPDTEARFRETEFTFRVLDSPVINAFALPGGYVYFTRGILAHLSNEAQLAVVMGHEIGHVAARHASQRALQQTLGQVAVIGGAVIGQELLGLPGESLLQLSSTAAQLLFLSYSREHERESDRLGVEYAAMNGYVASEGAALFTSLKRIAEQSGQSIPNFVSTHPDPGEREENIPRYAARWEEEGYEQTITGEDRFMEMIDGIVFGENPRQGFTRDYTFYHPDLAFRFDTPSGWDVINQPSQVALLSPEEDAVILFSIDSGADSPRNAIEAVLSQDGIEPLEQSETRSRGGFPAWEAQAAARLNDGTPVGLHLYAVEYGDYIYRFLSYSTEQTFPNHVRTFSRIAGSFDELTDREILGIQPARLRVFRAERSGTLESFLPERLPLGIAPDEVAIINQMNLDSPVREGEWIKIPVQD